MPRFVRPSFVRIIADGYAKPLTAGPKRRTGSLDARFTVRSNGAVTDALRVEMIGSADGESVRAVVTMGPEFFLAHKNADGTLSFDAEFKQ